MRFAVIQFPGSNCDQDCFHALRDSIKVDVRYVWHKETSLAGFGAIVIPGGFSYGDYLRSGAIARFSPVMRAVVEKAESGKPVIGICNGFQILCETGLLPGALIRNRNLRFVCQHTHVRVESSDSPFTSLFHAGEVLNIPIAHGEGNYFASPEDIAALEGEDRILMRYTNANGQTDEKANPNGSANFIAGICNARRNVFGLMPHPDRACAKELGSEDGKRIFQSMIESAASA